MLLPRKRCIKLSSKPTSNLQICRKRCNSRLLRNTCSLTHNQLPSPIQTYRHSGYRLNNPRLAQTTALDNHTDDQKTLLQTASINTNLQPRLPRSSIQDANTKDMGLLLFRSYRLSNTQTEQLHIQRDYPKTACHDKRQRSKHHHRNPRRKNFRPNLLCPSRHGKNGARKW